MKIKINAFQLKCIAIVTMFIDHVGAILFPGELIFRYIGRISFPIFCFLLIEGFSHTRDIRKYMIRLAIFALISEIPYDLAFRHTWFDIERQNVFFTLLIGIVMMYALERCATWPEKAIVVILSMWNAVVLKTDYNFKGILLISIYYFLRKYKWIKLSLGAVWNLLWGEIQRYGAFASLLLMAYNGEKGRSLKYFFYVFYPLHLLFLYGISLVLAR